MSGRKKEKSPQQPVFIAAQCPTSNENLRVDMFFTETSNESQGSSADALRTSSSPLDSPVYQRKVSRSESDPLLFTSPSLETISARKTGEDNAIKSFSAYASSNDPNPTIPENTTVPEKIFTCPCSNHLKTMLLDEVLEVAGVHKLFGLYFSSTHTSFYRTVHLKRNSDVASMTFSKWKPNPNGQMARQLNYNVAFKAPMLPASTTKCIETQTIIHKDDNVFVVECNVKTPNVPFGEAFSVIQRFCISSETSKQVRLKLSMVVEFSR